MRNTARRISTEPVIVCGSPSAECQDCTPHHPWEIRSPHHPWEIRSPHRLWEQTSLPVPPIRGPAVPWAEAAWKVFAPDE